MTNLCSLSKLSLSLKAVVGAALIGLAIQLVMQNWIGAALMLLPCIPVVFALRFFKTTTQKISMCNNTVAQVAAGQLDSRVILLKERGLLGNLGNNINGTLDLTEAFTKEANTAMEYANQRRYFRKIVPTGLRGGFVLYANTINQSLDLMGRRDAEFKDFVNTKVVSMANTVSSASTELNASAQTISGLSQQTVGDSNAVAAGAEQASANVQAVAAAVEEFTAATSEIAQQVQRVATISNEAVTILDRSDKTTSQLKEAAVKIGNILELIDKIADQTKLLALNATIEAARAGENGKGFAVVASEVKTLAEQTATATENISVQVKQMQSIVNETVASVQNTGKAVKQIDQAASTVAAAAEEQKAACAEIARNLNEAVKATGVVTESIVRVNQATQEAGRGIQQVSVASEDLSQHASLLMKQVDEFLGRL